MRTFDVIDHFLLFIKMGEHFTKEKSSKQTKKLLVQLLNSNDVCARPLLDIHSLTIVSLLVYFIEQNDLVSAKSYLSNILNNMRWAKDSHNRLPDANNSVENVIRFIVRQEKSVYYVDGTSPLLTAILEFTAILNLEEEYNAYRDFVLKNNIDLGIFIPHHGINSSSMELIENRKNDLEEQLFSESFDDGYQSELRLENINFGKNLSQTKLDFDNFKKKIFARKNEFEYTYRTDKSGYPFLRDLAHLFYKTPYFPDKWRILLK